MFTSRLDKVENWSNEQKICEENIQIEAKITKRKETEEGHMVYMGHIWSLEKDGEEVLQKKKYLKRWWQRIFQNQLKTLNHGY